MRIGHGFDVHAFGGKGPIIIGGVCIPYKKGLVAYSDGDVVLHAVIDALLGAAALCNIGQLFPSNNPLFKNINSRFLLREAWRHIQVKNYIIGNIDITIISQEPKMIPYLNKMRLSIAKDLDSHVNNINIKATTTEKLGFIGRCEGVACEAVCLLIK